LERFLCTAVPIDKGSCPVQSLPVQSAAVREEELRNTVMQLRETILQQKETIVNQLETIKELTSKLSRCESDSEAFRKINKDTMDDVPKIPNDTIDVLGKTMQSLKDRLENLEVRGFILIDGLSHYYLRCPKRQKGVIKLFCGPSNFKISLPLRTNYLFGQVKKSLPEMYAFTICMWLKSGLSPGIGTPFSYGVPGQANEIVLIEWGHNPIELLINDKVAQLPLSLSDGRWHHVCITWTTRDGLWEAYQDGQRLGSGENLAPWHPIKPGGVLILGQEQDVVGGRFDATQAFVGELSHFNVWDRVLRSTDITAMSNCSSYIPGNVVAWTDSNIEVFGGASKWPLELCEDRLFDN
uniref:Neuronal pentraxin IIb n=1 Tax=Sinocyclocheilus anshuiensis TaxID=1608454 RepID=A0A671MXM2_9TELE